MISKLIIKGFVRTLRVFEELLPEKSGKLLIFTFCIWLGTILLLGKHLIPIVLSAETVMQYFVLSAFSVLLCFFWLLGSYYLSLVIIYFYYKETNSNYVSRYRRVVTETPPVAILYPTCDDFQRDAIMTCLRQAYPIYRVFILDDSSSTDYQSRIDEFSNEHSDKVTVIRRRSRKGFKAGNLNYALNDLASSYPYFAIMDADEKIPENFLNEMMSLLINSGKAFVQANHAPNPMQASIFSQKLGQTILPFWSVLMSVKNKFGFVPCVGHGIIIRKSAWEEVGGFPEVASEDLAFAALLVEKGMEGIFTEKVVCYEDFPPSMTSFKLQQERYIPGVLHVLINYWPKLLRSKKTKWVEKIDFLMGSLPLYIPVLCFFYILVCAIGMPLCFGRYGHIEMKTFLGIIRIPFIQAFDGRFQSLWDPFFVIISVVISFSPAFPMLALAMFKKIKRPFYLLVVSNLAYMSTILVSVSSMAKYLFGGKVPFLPTGAAVNTENQSIDKLKVQKFIFALEIVFGLLVGGVLFTSLNFSLAGVAFCPMLSSLNLFDRRNIYFIAMPVFLGIVLQLFIGTIFFQINTIPTPLVSSIHF